MRREKDRPCLVSPSDAMKTMQNLVLSHCQCEYVIHLGFTSLVQLRDRLFQSFVGNQIANLFRSNTLNIQAQEFKSN